MARKPITDRERQLKLAYERLAKERAASKAAWRKVQEAKRALDALGRCDWCGDRTFPTGADLQLCRDCADERNRQGRIALLKHHGYGPDGKKLPKPAAA